jgi:hypothetical protein
MGERSIYLRALCWVFVGLALSFSTSDLCIAQALEEVASPDSTVASPDSAVSLPDSTVVTPEAAPVFAPADTDTTYAEDRPTPVYKRWWVWVVVTVVVAGAAALLAGSGDKEDEDLPDFPDPPGR